MFQEKLESNPRLFYQFYLGILEIFGEYRQTVADEILCLQDFDAESQRRISITPSYLHFDLNAFLSTLRKDRILALPERSALIQPQASQTQVTFFAVSRDGQQRQPSAVSMTFGYARSEEDNA